MSNYVYATLLLPALFLFMSTVMEAQAPAAGKADPTASVPGLTPEERNMLRDGGKESVTRFFRGRESPSIIPETELAGEIRRICANLEPDYGVETVMAARIPEELRMREDRLTVMYRILMSVSTMEGIRYFSVSRNAEHTLFEKSYRIAGPRNRTRIPDTDPERIPDKSTIHVLQKDTTFGENLYEAGYRATGSELMLEMKNLTPLKLAFFTAVDEGNMRIMLLIVPSGDFLLFYGISAVRAGLPLFEDKAVVSFQNRMEALFRWFVTWMETAAG